MYKILNSILQFLEELFPMSGEEKGITKKVNKNQIDSDNVQISFPQVVLDSKNFEVRINGQLVNYQNLTLTNKGLQIGDQASDDLTDQQNVKIMVDLSASVEFDTKFNENKYCVQLAKSIQRSSNAVYYRYQKCEKIKNNKSSVHLLSTRLQISEYIVRKIPVKPRCFQIVLRNLAIYRIKFLFQNDSFFMEIVLFIFRIVFKVDLSQFISEETNAVNTYQKSITIHESSEDQKLNEGISNHFQRTQKKKFTKPRLNQFEQKIFKNYKDMEKNIKKYRKCFQRINLLLQIFTRQTRLSTFLYELNKDVISLDLGKDLKNLLLINQVSNVDGSELLNVKQTDNLFQIVGNVIKLIKTINMSLGKSQLSFKILKEQLLSSGQFVNWLKAKIIKIGESIQISNKFVELMALICQFGYCCLSNLYSTHQLAFNIIIKSQVQWAYLTLHSQYSSESEQKQQQRNVISVLDSLFFILQTSIKQTVSSINIGRTICKYICNTAIYLRETDIKSLTKACCVNHHSRQMLLKFLFSYFRKFIRSVKNSLRGPWSIQVRNAKKCKLKMLEIMQSIRKISQIESIDFAIDEELVNDIRLIIQTAKCKRNNTQERNDCIQSVYLAMIKNVRVETSKQKHSQTQDTEGF